MKVFWNGDGSVTILFPARELNEAEQTIEYLLALYAECDVRSVSELLEAMKEGITYH